VHLFELLLVPVFAYYFLVDWPHIVSTLTKLIPPRHRDRVFAISAEIDDKISHWVRGQLIVVFVLAVLYAVALSIVGIQLAVPIGILTGILTFIPYVGTAVGLALSLSMALLDWSGPAPLIGVLGVFAALHVLEQWVLVPKLVGTKVGLGEAGALFGVLAGAQLLGFVGVLLAIPIAASVAVLVRHGIKYYESTEFFTYGDPVAAVAGSVEAVAPPPPEDTTPPPPEPKVEE
jgi:predicted PurR-regulated permease PerM